MTKFHHMMSGTSVAVFTDAVNELMVLEWEHDS